MQGFHPLLALVSGARVFASSPSRTSPPCAHTIGSSRAQNAALGADGFPSTRRDVVVVVVVVVVNDRITMTMPTMTPTRTRGDASTTPARRRRRLSSLPYASSNPKRSPRAGRARETTPDARRILMTYRYRRDSSTRPSHRGCVDRRARRSMRSVVRSLASATRPWRRARPRRARDGSGRFDSRRLMKSCASAPSPSTARRRTRSACPSARSMSSETCER